MKRPLILLVCVLLVSCNSGKGKPNPNFVLPGNPPMQFPVMTPAPGSSRNYVDVVIELQFADVLAPATVNATNFTVTEDPSGANAAVNVQITLVNASLVQLTLSTDLNTQLATTNYKFNTTYRVTVKDVETTGQPKKKLASPFFGNFTTAGFNPSGPTLNGGEVAINECYPKPNTNPAGPPTDLNGDGQVDNGDEFVEVVNRTDKYVDMATFHLIELPASAADPEVSTNAQPVVFHSWPGAAQDVTSAIPPMGVCLIWRGAANQGLNIGHSVQTQARGAQPSESFANRGTVNAPSGGFSPQGVTDAVGLIDSANPQPNLYDVLIYQLPDNNNPPPPPIGENSYNRRQDGGAPATSFILAEHVPHRGVQGANPNTVASPGTKVDGTFWE